MSTQKLGAVVGISAMQLNARPGAPSDKLREFEARIVADLAEKAHLAGQQFDGWPKFELEADGIGAYRYTDTFLLRATVLTRAT